MYTADRPQTCNQCPRFTSSRLDRAQKTRQTIKCEDLSLKTNGRKANRRGQGFQIKNTNPSVWEQCHTGKGLRGTTHSLTKAKKNRIKGKPETTKPGGTLSSSTDGGPVGRASRADLQYGTLCLTLPGKTHGREKRYQTRCKARHEDRADKRTSELQGTVPVEGRGVVCGVNGMVARGTEGMAVGGEGGDPAARAPDNVRSGTESVGEGISATPTGGNRRMGGRA